MIWLRGDLVLGRVVLGDLDLDEPDLDLDLSYSVIAEEAALNEEAVPPRRFIADP